MRELVWADVERHILEALEEESAWGASLRSVLDSENDIGKY